MTKKIKKKVLKEKGEKLNSNKYCQYHGSTFYKNKKIHDRNFSKVIYYNYNKKSYYVGNCIKT